MNKVHLIGNAHLDPVWLWRWQEGFSEILATFRSALDRMKDFPDFIFTSACSAYYEWVEEIDPTMFEEIKQRVREGRWHIVGGWYLQPDCNLPDGESFARHGLIGQRYFKEKFGVTATTGYNVDSFGHNANLPKILKASGMDNYTFMRPYPEEQGRNESLFEWKADDDSSVFAYRLPLLYCITLNEMELFDKINKMVQTDNMDHMAFYGVGNHGGGPTIGLIDAINKLDMEKTFSHPDRYFAEADKENLPVLQGDLQHHARGCYSAVSKIKKMNRKGEHNLLAAEKMCVMAKELTGLTYPADQLRKAWKNLLFNQFHDIICGCAIKKAYTDAEHLYGEVMSITERAINASMQSIAWNIDTLKGEKLPAYKLKNFKLWEHEVLGTPITVFNPHSWSVKAVVQVNHNATKIEDAQNREIPFQLVRGDQTNRNNDIYHTAFVAEVPAMGYATYRLFAEKDATISQENDLCVTERCMENSKIKVVFDEKTGDISQVYDKENKKYIIDKPLRAILLDETLCDTWAHDKTILGETIGEFGDPVFNVVETGPVRGKLKVTTTYNQSKIVREYVIMPYSDEIRVKTVVDFQEKHRTLKFTFPMTEEKIITKIPYGTIEKHGYTGEEPCGSWLASGNLCVANDSKYGYDTQDGEVRMTVLRSAVYADHYGERDEFCEYMDLGVSEFYYSLFPYSNNADCEKKAEELNFALPYIMGSFHKGPLPEVKSCIVCNEKNIIVTAVKQAEDNKDNIIRLYETEGKDVSAEVRLFDKKISVTLSHNAVKTYSEDGKELNMLEWQDVH